MISQVLFASPVNKHPELQQLGLVDGLLVEPVPNSTTLPDPLGVMLKDELGLQRLMAFGQSPGFGGGFGFTAQIPKLPLLLFPLSHTLIHKVAPGVKPVNDNAGICPFALLLSSQPSKVK